MYVVIILVWHTAAATGQASNQSPTSLRPLALSCFFPQLSMLCCQVRQHDKHRERERKKDPLACALPQCDCLVVTCNPSSQQFSFDKRTLNFFKFSSDLQGLMLVFQGIPGSHAMQKRSGSQQAVTSCCSVQTQFRISAKPSHSHAHTTIVSSPNTPLHPCQNPMAAWPQQNESYTEHLQVRFRSKD